MNWKLHNGLQWIIPLTLITASFPRNQRMTGSCCIYTCSWKVEVRVGMGSLFIIAPSMMNHKDCLSLLYGHYHHGGSARYSYRLERMIVPTGRVSIKILPCQYMGSYCIDLYNENPYTWKDSLYWDGPTFMFPWLQTAWWWWRWWWVGGCVVVVATGWWSQGSNLSLQWHHN